MKKIDSVATAIKRNKTIMIYTLCATILYFAALANTVGPRIIPNPGSLRPTVYVSIAQALASGKGYSDIALVNQPQFTQYPPGFPTLLAAIMLFFPAFPANALWLQLICMVSALAGVIFTFLLLRESDPGVAKQVIAWTLLLTVLSPYIVSYSTQFILSEIPYWLCSVASLYFICLAEKKAGNGLVLDYSRGNSSSLRIFDQNHWDYLIPDDWFLSGYTKKIQAIAWVWNDHRGSFSSLYALQSFKGA